MATVYYSDRCANCKRFLTGVQRSSSLRDTVQLVNVDVTPVQNLQYVPTVVLHDSGAMYVGTVAFEWLKQHGANVEDDLPPDLEAYSSSACGLGFSEFNGDGCIKFHEPFSSFSPVD
jgi:hypothetical protein